ncbi:TetR/AcrR family transcriptional regulator [Salinisphaera sp. LB1]|uniref:TetR/AcrR family transcriptional regulator n=1 Tax=Salinisphaera sp. LB1 TaxID=2183911 RepID=UPI000D706288|nr:TetR/AcrR family transcriptional regulator [Salinisphaera sp. LB1]AWN15794.1 Transcriptional regulator, TetR family [Salinisphaera sp. LB1]
MRVDAKKNYDRLLAVAGEAFADQGADASLRDIARRAGVGLGTLYRHFPTREALLEALLRASFEALVVRAGELETSDSADNALVVWMKETTEFTHSQHGIIALMMDAIEDPNSALHASCVMLRAAGTALLTRAQAEGKARDDLNGAELFDIIAALAWLREQPSHAPRADHLFDVVAGSILTDPSNASMPPRANDSLHKETEQ